MRRHFRPALLGPHCASSCAARIAARLAAVKSRASRARLEPAEPFKRLAQAARSALCAVLAILAALVAPAGPAAASTIVVRSFHATALGRDWPYAVYLPTGYRTDAPRYPVLYLLHGNNGDALDWVTQGDLQNTIDTLIARHEIPPVVVVMPQGGTDWYVDRKEKMETAFFADLIPEIQSRFAVEDERGGRAIGGVSMGGFGALRYTLEHPDMFCGALLLSPAIYSGDPPPSSSARRVGVFGEHQFDPHVWRALNYPTLWSGYFGRPWRVPIFIASGDDDLVIQAESSLLYTRLREAGNPAALRIVDGGHVWPVWRELLPAALKYALACVH